MTRFITFACLCTLLLFPALVAAQHVGHGASGLAHGIPDFCATATDRVIVPAGGTRTIGGRFETSCLGVHGTLIIVSNTTVRVDELLVYDDGAVVVGTADQPASGVEIIIRDRPLDLAGDPEQFGQGIIGFGKFHLFGIQANGTAPRSIVIRSENPSGIRGHIILTQRADVDIRYVSFEDLGRTRASDPLNSTTFAGEIATHTGTNQIGRYALHLHHVMGPPPGSGRSYQFQLIGNLFLRNAKWGGVTLHNSHFGLIQNNYCTKPEAVCYVEEDGSETANQWIGNYAGQATGEPCQVFSSGSMDYDPEGRCPSGFWLRAQHQVLRNNVVEDMQRGISWWTTCLEEDTPTTTCAGRSRVTVPKFPGADTTDPAQLEACSHVSSPDLRPCHPGYRRGMVADGNIIRRGFIGVESWWTTRLLDNGGFVITGPESTGVSPDITNTRTEDVAQPIHLRYSDLRFDGFVATGCTRLITQFNDVSSAINVRGESRLDHATATCSGAIYRQVGQLAQPPMWRIRQSTLTSPVGIWVEAGGDATRSILASPSTFTIEDSTVTGPVFHFTVAFAVDPRVQLVMTAKNVNGQTFSRTWNGTALDAPLPGTTASPTVTPQADPTTTVPQSSCRFPPESGRCR